MENVIFIYSYHMWKPNMTIEEDQMWFKYPVEIPFFEQWYISVCHENDFRLLFHTKNKKHFPTLKFMSHTHTHTHTRRFMHVRMYILFFFYENCFKTHKKVFYLQTFPIYSNLLNVKKRLHLRTLKVSISILVHQCQR